MAKTYKVIINIGKEQAGQTFDVVQGAGDRGQPVRIKAQAGAKYQLQEMQRNKQVAPDGVKVKRVGKDLWLMFEDERQPSLILEDYYDVMPEGYNGVVGQAENGLFYEYIPEDPSIQGLVSELAEGGQAVNVALGGVEVSGAGAAVGVFAFPWLGALGVLGGVGAAGVVASQALKKDEANIQGGDLASASDSGQSNADNVTQTKTNLVMQGKGTPGSTVDVWVKNSAGEVVYQGKVTADADGNFSYTVPGPLADGVYTPYTGGTQGTPFTIDTVTRVDITEPGQVGGLLPISGTAEPGGTVVVKGANGQVLGTATANAQGTWQITPTTPVPAGAITAEVTDPAGNKANDSGVPVSPSVKTALSLDPISGDNVLLASESGASTLPVSGTVTGTFTAGDVVNLSLNGKNYAAKVGTDGRFSVPVSMADLKADPDTQIEARITGTNGDTASAAQDYTVEASNTPTQTGLLVDPVTADNIVSASEKTGNVAITGQATGKFVAGDVVTVSVNGNTFTGTVAANGKFSIDVPGTDLAADPDTQLQARMSGTGGSTAQAMQDYALSSSAGGDRNAILPPSGELAPASDSGVPGDSTTRDSTPELIGQVPAGSTATITLNGKTYPVTVAPDGSWTFTQPDGLPDGTYTPVLNVTQNGQTTATPIDPFTIDTVTRVDITEPGRVGSLSPISGTAEPGGTVVVKGANGQVLGTVTANAQGTWQITPTVPVPAGAITAEVTDPAGNKANDSGTPVSPSVKTALSLDPISGDNILLASETGATALPVTGKVTGTFKEGDVVNVSLNGKTYATSVAADGSFSVSVSMADLKADPDTQIEATITGTNGDNATAAQDYTVEAGNTPAQTALSVDPVTADNILSAAETTGNVPITGQATGKFTAGDAVTVNVNGKTFTGTVAADGKFSINVPAADLAADPDTQLEARLSGTGGVTAQAIQDYALDTTTPTGVKTALSLDLISGDNVLLASESGATTLPVTGKVTGTFKEGDVVNVSLNGKTYTTSVAADGSFSVPVAMADLKADSDTKIEARITGTNGDIATAAQDYTVEAGNTPTQTALSLDPVTADNVLSPAEAIGSVAITGQVTGKFATGDTVTLSVNGKTFTGTVAADGKFSINVPGADLDADPNTQIEARITGTGGTAATAFEDYALSSASGGGSNPVLPPSGDLAPGSDSGVPGDGITNDTTPTIIGQVPAGSTATITLNGKTYPVDVKPDGSYTFTQPDGLPDGTYTPVLNVTKNGETTSTPIYPFTIDTVPPSVAISADKIQLLAGQTSTITFTLSEAVSDFSAADITVSGGTLGNLVQSQTDPKVYTAVFTPNASSTTTSVISVASGRFSDAANNFNTDGAEANNTLNLPTNTQTPGGTIFLAPSSDSGTPADHRTNDNTPTMTGQVPVGSTAEVSINGKTYPVDVKPDGSYTFTVPTGLPDGTYVPKIIITPAGSSTPNAPQDGTPFTIDTVAPTVLVSSDKATLATGQTAAITFTLSEDSSDFTLADVTATGGTLSKLQGSGKVYTAVFTPSADSTTTSTVKVDSFKFSDAAGNFNTDGSDTGVGNTNIVSMPTNTAQADTTAPTIALSADRTSLATGQTTVVTFTLSEASSDFALADVTATGGTLANLVQSQTDPKIYTAVFTPNASSTTPSVISVASNKFSDAAGNPNTDGADANNTLSLPTNTTPAQTSGQLQPSSDSGTQGDNKTLDNTPAYGGTAPAGSKVEVEINGKTYTTVADSNGQYTVVVPDALPDGTYVPKIIVTPAGSSTPNAPQDGTPFTIDTTPPMVEVTSDKGTLGVGQTATITFTLNEASSDFTLADVQVSGGTLSNFQGSGTSYTATFTPNAGSTDPSVVHVASNKFADAAGNANTDGAQSNNTVSMVTNTIPADVPANDTTAPSIIVSRTNPGASLAANASETINFTLSEPSLTFGLTDVTVTGGTLSNFTAIPSSGTAGTGYTQYNATFTPTPGSAGTATVGVAAGTFSDNAGNLNADTFVLGNGYQSDNQVSLAYNTVPADTTPPAVAVSRAGSGSLTLGGSETITFVLSEASTNFNLSDIDVSGGTLANFAPLTTSGNASSGYTQYTATFTPNANALGTAAIGVASGKFTDASNNANLDTYLTGIAGTSLEANNLVNINFNTQLPDTTAPTVAVARASAGTVSSTETVYFTLSEASSSFTLSDVDVVGGSLSNFAPVASTGSASLGYTQYSATFTPTANAQGNATIGVASAKFSDAAGNLNADTYVTGAGYEANNQVSMAFNTLVPDTTVPSIAITRAGSGVVTGTETLSFTLSEASSNFTLADIDVTGGTLSNFQPVSSSGSVSLGYTEYTATFTPTANTLGTGSVGVLSGKFTDAASNANTDTYAPGVAGTTQEGNNLVSFAINTDTTAPTVAVSRTSSGSGTVTGAETLNFTLSEASSDFTLADITVTGGTLSNFQGSGTSYTATFTPTAGTLGTATIGVLSAKFADAAGNLNKDTFASPASGSDVYEANNLVSLPVNTDSTAPTIVVARAGSGTLSSAETINFTLSEASSSFDASDVVVSGGTLSNFAPVSSSGNSTSGYTQYTATFTPAANSTGTATVGVTSDKFADAAGNLNKDTYLAGVTGTTQEANNQVSMAYNTQAPDTTAPTVVVSRSGAGFVNGSEIINFTLSEASTDFSLADITVTGGTLSGFSGSGSNYSATFTPTANALGTGTVGVAAGTFADAAGNRNLDTFVAGNVAGTVTESNNQVSLPYNTDTTAPTVVVARTGSGTVSSTGETIRFTLSEASSNFALSDIDVTGGTLSNWVQDSTNPLIYTALFMPSANGVGVATVGVASSKFSDAAGNFNADTYLTGVSNTTVESNNQVSFNYSNDSAPPSIAISSNQASLTTGQTATITFTLSEASSDFTAADIETSGGSLGPLTRVGVNSSGQDVYTATFTPTANSTTSGVVRVASDKFSDAAGNLNKDTYAASVSGTTQEANNSVSLTVNTTVVSGLTLSNDSATAKEAGVQNGGNTAEAGTHPSTTTQSAGVLGNDTAATSVTQIAASGGSNSAVSSGSTGASGGTTVTGQYGTLVMGANGTYTYTLSNTNGTVNALQAGSSLSDVFTYTATDGTTPQTANLTVTINGTNDAPTVALPLEDRTGIELGRAVNYTFDSGTFADVDTADTKSYTATMADGSALPSWLTFNATTRNFSGTPPAVGTYAVKVIATDSRGATTSDEFNIAVIDSRSVVVNDNLTALTIEPVTGDNVILNSENTGSITLTGQVTGTFVEGDIVTLLINGTNYTAAAAANGRYSVSVLASDLAADADKQVIGSVNGTGGDLGTAAQRYVLETGNTATQTALSIDPVTADNVVLSSEAVAGKIAVTGKVTGVFATGDVVSLVIKNVTYTAAAAANGRFSVDVDFTDLQGDSDTIVNGTVTGTGGTVATATQDYALADEAAPKIAITRSGSGTNTGAETITFTLTEASSNFVEADVDVTGGALSNWTAVSGTVYTATFTPTANSAGTASVGVTSGKFSDAAGNLNKDTYLSGVTDTTQESNNQVSFNYNTDTTPPTVSVTRAGSGTMSGTETITFTLSEASSDFTQADVFVTSGAGTLSNWTAVSSTVYTATFTPTVNSSGSVTIGVASDRFVDAGGNLNKDTYLSGVSGATQEANNSVVFNYSTDITTPTVAVTRAGTGAVSGPETITFTLSEASTDFTQADVFVTPGAGALSNWTAVSSTVYTATFTPTANSAASVTIGVASDKFADAAGNNNKDTYLSGVSGALQETNNAVIFDADTQAPTQTVTFSSMTKDSGLGTVSANNTSSNANWITADGSAGRLVSGAISANLAAGEVVEVYVNKGAGPVKIGNATVNGTHWAVTDHSSYVSDASWTYSAKVVDAAGNSGTTQTQAVTSDYVASAPVITSVVDSTNTTVPHNGASSRQTFTSISGTGNAGDVLVVVDNQYNNVVGTVVVGGNGQWSLTNLANISAGASNTFAAYQLDTHGNQSAYSNLYTVSTPFTTNFDGSFGTGTLIGGVPANYTIVANSPDVLTPESGLHWRGTASPDGGSFFSVFARPSYSEIASFNVNNLVVGQQYSIGFYQTATGVAQSDGSTADAGSGYFQFTSGGTVLGRSTDTGPVDKAAQLANGFVWTRETVTFTATGTSMTIAMEGTRTGTDSARLALDGLTIAPAAVTPAVSALGGPTSSADSLTYTGGGLDGLAGADTITVSGTDLQTKLAAGGYINGGAAVDTLKLAAGTTLNLNTLMDNQTVGNLRELEIFQMQGTSTLTMSANDVLSLGGSNASTMSAYGFSSTSDGSGTGFNSTGKVQFVVNGTVTDTVNLTALAVDSVTGASGQFGNTGLSGQWSFIGTTTIGGVVYKVYNHSTTEAQVLVNNAVVNNATDTTPPTVAVTRSGTGDMSGAETITFTLSEGSSDFTESDVFVTSGAGVLSNWTTVSSRVYTATFTPAANSTGSVTIGVASDKFADTSANRNLDTYLSGVSGTTQEANNAVVFNRDTIAPTQTVTFSSMTKDTGLTTVTTNNSSSNANWTTADGSAGRLVSGSVSAALNAGEVVEVYVNKMDGAGTVKIGNATTNGTHWAVTDHTNYVSNAAWVYSAKVVDAAGNSGSTRTQNVMSDYVESAPVITSSTNASNATVAHQGTTNDLLKTISGTGNPGDTVFLVQNTDTSVVGSATVGVNGQWSITLPGTLPGGANSYAAYQLDPHGNASALSNVWQVNQNLPVNDGFDGSFGTTNTWNTVVTGMTIVKGTPDLMTVNGSNIPANTIASADGGAFYSAVGSTFGSSGTDEQSSFRLNNLVVGGTYAMNFLQSVIGWDSNGLMWNDPGNFEFYSGTTLLGSSDQMVGRTTGANVWTADTVTFTATASTMDITIAVKSVNGSQNIGTRLGMDAFSVQQVAGTSNADSTLVAGRWVGGPTTSGETLAFVDGALTGLAGSDTITVSSNQLQAKLAAGGYIDGDAGADTLRLAAGTVLDLDRLTRNQTVKPIQEVEIFQLQGGSTLSLSANDVLSLGGSNATTMSGFNFSSTTSGTGAGFNSTGKVQFVVQGTNTDQVKLVPLQLDGVLDAAGEPGNLGLAGQWTDIGLTNIGGVVYQVYNHSTTQAQVLVSNATVQLPSNPQTVAITSAAISSTSFVQEFVAPQVATSKAQKSVTTDDGNWTISATGANGQTLPTIADNNGNVGYYVSIGERWTGLPGTELNLGEQTTQLVSGGRREYKFTSNTGPFDFVAFNYTDTNFNADSWINFYNAAGQLIDRTQFVPVINQLSNPYTYNIKDGGLATSFMIDMNTDDTWGLDKLTTGVQQSAAEVASGASIMDATPLLKGTYSANLAVGEVIAVYDGATKLGNAVIDADTKTWSYQTSSNLSVAAHTFTAKVETAGGTATATSGNFSLTLLSSPLALDLNGDGVQTMGIEQGVQFDLLATGSAQNVGWLDAQDGWLAIDLDANGLIDSGAELLGSNTRLADGSLARDGWQALAQYDGNADGVIDAGDEVFLDLKVWVDADSDGQTDAGEMRTLMDHQILRFDLGHNAAETEQNGNILQGLSSFTTDDGQSHQMVDAWLKVEDVLTGVGEATMDLANVTELAAAEVATAGPAPAGELLQLDQLLSAAPSDGLFNAAQPVLDSSSHNAMLQSMLDLHNQNPVQS